MTETYHQLSCESWYRMPHRTAKSGSGFPNIAGSRYFNKSKVCRLPSSWLSSQTRLHMTRRTATSRCRLTSSLKPEIMESESICPPSLAVLPGTLMISLACITCLKTDYGQDFKAAADNSQPCPNLKD